MPKPGKVCLIDIRKRRILPINTGALRSKVIQDFGQIINNAAFSGGIDWISYEDFEYD